MTHRVRYLGWPNRISLTRLLLVWPFVACLLNLKDPEAAWLRWVAIGIFAVMAMSDLLDGYLARRLHDESELGKFLDPLADKFLITSAVLILGAVGIGDPQGPEGTLLTLPNWVVLSAIGKDILVCVGVLVIYLATGRILIEARPIGKWCTTVQLVLVLTFLLAVDLPPRARIIPLALGSLATALAVGATIDYVRLGLRFMESLKAKE